MLGTNHFKGQKPYFKVLGYDNRNGYYILGYTSDKKACLNYHMENGWKKKDVKFINMGTPKRG
tara:strand:+ start:52 stop:240 length:189 start_codon:yes stop_codon:yes gene_type:complete